MDTNKILAELRSERERIDKAIAAVEALTTGAGEAIVRPRATREAKATKPAPTKRAAEGKRTMSAAARRKISEAAKRRWAERKRNSSKA